MNDIRIIKFHKNGVQYETTRLEPPAYLQPPVPVTTTHNKAKGRGTTKPVWDIIAHRRRQYVAVNAGYEYDVVLDGIKRLVSAETEHQLFEVTGFVSLDVTVVEHASA